MAEGDLSPLSPAIGMAGAIAAARDAMGQICAAPVDGVVRCDHLPEGGWAIVIEVIEVPARMGDNDLLTAYEVRLDPAGQLCGFGRMGRYHREDAGAA